MRVNCESLTLTDPTHAILLRVIYYKYTCESLTSTYMRVEPYTINSYVHVTKRGARGLPIVRSKNDKDRFVRLLYYMNDTYKTENWEREILAMIARHHGRQESL